MKLSKKNAYYAIICLLFVTTLILFSFTSSIAEEDEDYTRDLGDATFSIKYYFMNFSGGDFYYTNNSSNMSGVAIYGDLWLHNRGAFDFEYFYTTGDNGPLGFNYPLLDNGPANFNMDFQNLTLGGKFRVSEKEYLSTFALFLNYRKLSLTRDPFFELSTQDFVTPELDFDGFGFGFKKEHAPWRKYDVYGQLGFYPSLNGARYDLEVLTYEIGFSAKLSDSFSANFGYRGENFEFEDGKVNSVLTRDFYLVPEFNTNGFTAGVELVF